MKITETEVRSYPKIGFVVWYACPVSGVMQTYATFDTKREANACARELKKNGLGA